MVIVTVSPSSHAYGRHEVMIVPTQAIENQLRSVERAQRLPPQAILFREGEEPKGAYIIHSGQVELAFTSRKGLVRPMRSLGAGEIAGLESVMSDRPHDTTATTTTPVRVGFIPKEQLQELLAANPSAWFTVLRFLCQDVNACWSSMRAMSAR